MDVLRPYTAKGSGMKTDGESAAKRAAWLYIAAALECRCRWREARDRRADAAIEAYAEASVAAADRHDEFLATLEGLEPEVAECWRLVAQTRLDNVLARLDRARRRPECDARDDAETRPGARPALHLPARPGEALA